MDEEAGGRRERLRTASTRETHPDLRAVLFSAEEIRQRVGELAEAVSGHYAGADLHLVVVLRGAAVFAADLLRELTVAASVDFIAISSYGSASSSTGVVRLVKDLEDSVEERAVLVVEDIVDTGLTLSYLTDLLSRRNAASVEVCTLLDKPEARRVPIQPRFIGFRIPNEFVVGYGLDFNQQYRGLPYLGVLREEVYVGG